LRGKKHVLCVKVVEVASTQQFFLLPMKLQIVKQCISKGGANHKRENNMMMH
jgi:hypothetical protein